ncbi:hypothetical protein BGW42_006394, partial [Actinomortierella wolfii]
MPPTLPPECIERILMHIDDTGLLHSMLTLSRTWFTPVVRRLYYDPFMQIEYHQNTLSSLKEFLTLVLALSPFRDPVTDILRKELGVRSIATTSTADLDVNNASTPPSSLSPMIDYLAYIRVVRFSPKIFHLFGLLKREIPR